MNIKELIVTACVTLDKTDLANFIIVGNTDKTELVNEFTRTYNRYTKLCNTVISELAATFIPMVHTEKLNRTTDKIAYDTLAQRVSKIVQVKDDNGDNLFFKIHPTYVQVNGQARTVVYEYLPREYTAIEAIGYTSRDVSPTLLSFALVAEICLFEGRFEEAVAWRKRYSDGINAFVKPKNGYIKGRDFV